MCKISLKCLALSLQIRIAITLQNYTLNNEFDSIISCSEEIFKHVMYWRPTYVLRDDENQTGNKTIFNNLLIKTLVRTNQPFIITHNNDNSTLDTRRAAYLVVDYVEHCDALHDYNYDTIQRDVKYLLVIGYYSRVICDSKSEAIGKKVGRYDVSVFLKHTSNKLLLVTFIPMFDANTCLINVGVPKRINVCEDGHLTENTMFPIKNPTNMNKCPLKVGMSSLYPLAIIDNKEFLKNYDRLYNATGADVEIMKIVTQHFNATMDMYYVYKVEENPYVESTFLTFLLNGSLDILAGGMYRIYGEIVEYSGIYLEQNIVWIYTADRPKKTWNNFIGRMQGFYIFLIFYLTYSIAWFLTISYDKQRVSLSDTLMYGWGALTGTTSLGEAKTLKQKILNISYLIMCLHLSVFISIILYSFLTIVGPPEIFKTNEEVMDSGRQPYLVESSKYFMVDDKYVQFANTSKDCNTFNDCLQKSLENKGITLLIPGYFYGYQAATAVNDEARLLKVSDTLLHVYYEMIINKNSPLVEKFKRAVVSLFEGGITGRLFVEAIGINVVEKAGITARNMMSNSYSCQTGCTISMEQFYGAFYLWMFGCSVSVCVFVLELLKNRKLGVKID